MNGDPAGKGAGSVLGCLAALAAAPALAAPFLLATILADCPPGASCRREDPLFLYGGLALTVALAALLGFSVRALAGWGLARRRGGGGRFPAWAALAGGAVIAILAWIGWQAMPVLSE